MGIRLGRTECYLSVAMKRPTPPISIPVKNIKHIHYSGLSGRIAHYPATNKKHKDRNFVIVSGHHTSHERMVSFILFLADYGNVYSIDTPGFGGMDSFKKIKKPINFDSYGEYLYTILKTQKLTKNVTIFAVSIGGQYVTRMLQMYPETEAWLDRVIGFVTFGAGKDFHLKPAYKIPVTILAFIGSNPILRVIPWLLFFNRFSLGIMLRVFSIFKKKMKTGDGDLKKQFRQMEYYHWVINDQYTQAITTRMMFFDDLRRYTERVIRVPMFNILTKHDQYVDHKEVNKTMRDLYDNYKPLYLELGVHMPSMIADKREVAKLFDDEMINEIMNSSKTTG